MTSQYNRDPWQQLLQDSPLDIDQQLFLDLTPFLTSLRNGDVCLQQYKHHGQGQPKDISMFTINDKQYSARLGDIWHSAAQRVSQAARQQEESAMQIHSQERF